MSLPAVAQFDSPAFRSLVEAVGEACNSADENQWPESQLRLMDEAEVAKWFVPQHLGGWEWSTLDLMNAYLQLSQACLASTFILTQRVAALRRIAACDNQPLRDELLPSLLCGDRAATVGISHLTTSRRHLGQPALRATATDSGFVLDGMSPWVTGANGADFLVVGGELDDGQQILAVVATDDRGVTLAQPFDMLALTETHTGAVTLDKVSVAPERVVAGPTEEVLTSLNTGHSTGSFQTSALALGLTRAAIDFIQRESVAREDLREGLQGLLRQWEQTTEQLRRAASGSPDCTAEQLRTAANSLVLRATQAAMVAAKGAGFVSGHPVGKWCRQAMFFLVWSCPQAVRDANLCELAGVEI